MDEYKIQNWKHLIVDDKQCIKDAMALFEKNAVQIVFVVDENKQLIGSVTDGDIRRGLLSDAKVSSPVKKIMNTNPYCITEKTPKSEFFEKMMQLDIKYAPVINEKRKIVSVYKRPALPQHKSYKNPVVIMAGGEGKRLYPLTEKLPKPMVKFNGQPLLERTLKNLKEKGFENFFLSINYLGEVIEDYFGDGSDWGVNISYLREDKKLGTAGSLKLLGKQKEDIIVLNGDLVTSLSFSSLLEHHQETKSSITIAVQRTPFVIPYGVVHHTNGKVKNLEEKPRIEHDINCGIYALSPDALSHIKNIEYLDMPSLIERVLKQKQKVSTFSIFESWHDIADIHDLKKVQRLYVSS